MCLGAYADSEDPDQTAHSATESDKDTVNFAYFKWKSGSCLNMEI